MPGFTPVFGIQYPCAGENIDPTVFQTFADDVEAALSTVDALAASAVQRTRAQVLLPSPGQSAATGVLTSLLYTSAPYEMNVTTGVTGFTIVQPGIYMVTAEMISIDPSGTPATTTYWFGQVLQNGSIVMKSKQTDPVGTDPVHVNVQGLLSCAAADTLSTQWQWAGTGGPLEITARFSVAKVADP